MSQSWRNLPPFRTRLADGDRPVMSKEQLAELAQRIMGMTSYPSAFLRITHSAFVVTRVANGQVLTGDDGDTLMIRLAISDDTPSSWHWTRVRTNQLDDATLLAMVKRCEAMDKDRLHIKESSETIQRQVPDALVPVQLWHNETVQSMTTTRGALVPDILSTVAGTGLKAAGFLGIMARAETYVTREGIDVFYEETDSELTVTARTADGTGSGWGGQTARNTSTLDAKAVTRRAVDYAKRSANPVAIEPGRMTAILDRDAVAQVIHQLSPHFRMAAYHQGGFAKPNGGIRWHEKVFDERINMSSDPADPDGGYRPYFGDGSVQGGYGTPVMNWIKDGVLEEISVEPQNVGLAGRPYSAQPDSIRVAGGPTSVDEMISRCKLGVYVNRLYAVKPMESSTGLLTGVTRDGCFMIQDGKITRPVKNFRFIESPFFILNKLEALGPTSRAALGYIESPYEPAWPLQPVIVPPMMIRDFNFVSLAEAV